MFRTKEAVLSVLAGDIFGKTPIWSSIWMFKMLYIANIPAEARLHGLETAQVQHPQGRRNRRL